jgi:hypothetical protein
MTMSTKVSRAPVDLQDVHRDFEHWRRTRQAGARIPASLWSAAVAVARRYGVSRTARALHLEQRKLKHLANAETSAPRAAAAPAFVELLAPQPATESAECSIEVEGPRGGRLRISLRGMPVPDLVALSRVVWGPEA